MGSLAYSPPSGGGGTNYWQLNGDGSISPDTSNGSIEVQTANNNNQISVTDSEVALFNNTNTNNPSFLQLNPSAFILAAQGATTQSDMSATDTDVIIEVETVPSGESSRMSMALSLINIVVNDAVQYLSFITLLPDLLELAVNDSVADTSADVNITTTTAALRSDDSGGVVNSIAVGILTAMAVTRAAVILFQIENDGSIWTNQAVTVASTPLVAYTKYIPIYDNTGALLGRIPIV